MDGKRTTLVNKRVTFLIIAAISIFSLFSFFSFMARLGPNKTQSIIALSAPDPPHVSRTELPHPAPGSPSIVQTDYPEGIEDVYLMVKTGATVLWKRLPVHFMTTFKQVPYFQVYSDMAETVGDHHVVDTLQNVSEPLKLTEDFEIYRIQQEMQAGHYNVIPEKNGAITGSKKGWNLDKYKNLPMLQHAWATRPDAKWFIFMDADSYVLWTPLMNWLRTLDHRHALYMGSPAGQPPVQFAHGGSVVVISRGAMLRSFGKDPQYYKQYEAKTIKTCCGDLMVAHALYDSGIKIAKGIDEYPYANFKFLGEPPAIVKAKAANWCKPIMSFHHVDQQDIQRLHEFERDWKSKHDKDEYITYSDVFHWFMRPYMTEGRVEDWDNRSDDRKYSPTDPKAIDAPAHESLENCVAYCEAWSECLGWRYQTGMCALSESVRLGHKRLRQGDDLFDDTKKVTSGWMMDRIREFRAKSGCDRLVHEELQEKAQEKVQVNDDGDVSADSVIVPGLEIPGQRKRKGLFGF
ncbi:hypothetical protein BZA70DRAFT_290893 [Myxozyma melibiosi]|uniref:Glycosyltransferase family 31 protein n=1 Tax=Myxozyma melibiosi TaxID=54550 RepID=A0ABR1F1U5_9ASCO